MTVSASAGQIEIFEQADDLPPAWDSAARGGGLGLDSRFLRSLHLNAVDSGARRYVLYRSPSGATVIAVADLLLQPTARNPVMSILLGRLNSHLPSARNWLLPMLILHSDLTSDAPYRASGKTMQDRHASLSGMLAALEAYACRHGWSLAVNGVPVADRAMTDALSQHGFLRTVARPYATLRIQWDSWEEYLHCAARYSKNAANNIRQEIKRAQRDGLEIIEWNPADVPETELYRLVEDHERRMNHRAHHLRPGFISDLSKALGEDMRVLLATRSSRLEGMVAFVKSHTRGYVVYPGFVAEADRASFAYFNLAYYQPIRLAIEHRLESIAYGNAAFEAKIRRGCAATESALFVRPRERILRTALRLPMALHRRGLEHKYASVLRAAPFSNLIPRSHAHPADKRTS